MIDAGTYYATCGAAAIVAVLVTKHAARVLLGIAHRLELAARRRAGRPYNARRTK